MKKHHKFTHTTVEHHKDGSHTVTHHHEDGSKHDVKGAVGDHDAMMDHMMDHTAPPSADMAAADQGQHGIPPAAASAAGIPPAAAGAPPVAGA